MIILTSNTPVRIPMKDERKTGYQFLSPIIDEKTEKVIGFHPGIDLNSGKTGEADNGLPVYAMAAGEVIYSRNTGSGWGNLVVIKHPGILINGKVVYSRYAHFRKINVKKGDFVTTSSVIGECGKTGTKSSHCHWEAIIQPLPSWTTYVYGWEKAKLLNYFFDPYNLIKMANDQQKDYFLEAQEWAKKNGISNGDRMREPATRGEVMEMMRRLYELVK